MNQCIGVVFEEGGKEYAYKVPSYIKKVKVGDYVIVDTRHLSFCPLGCKAVKVTAIYDSNDTKSYFAKSFIIDTVNFKKYKKLLKEERERQEYQKKLNEVVDMIQEKHYGLKYEEHIEDMLNRINDEKLREQYLDLMKKFPKERV